MNLSRIGCYLNSCVLFTCVALVAGCGSHQVTRVEKSKEGAAEEKLPVSSALFREQAMEGNLEAVQSAVERGADVNKADAEGRTALMLASYDGHTEVVQVLLEHGAEVHLRDQDGQTALLYAASGPNAATVEALLDAGSDINIRDGGEGFTPLMYAASEGQEEVVRLLLARGADFSLKDVDGEDAVMFAQKNGHQAIAELIQQAQRQRKN